MGSIRAFLGNPLLLGAWLLAAAVCVVAVLRDLRVHNPQLGGLMKGVWVLTVAYSGPIGLAVYYGSGRRQMSRDSLWRRAFRSVSHCYSGCGAGEIVGVVLSVGLFAAGQVVAALVTFAFAYTFGLVLTVGPLVQEGEGFWTALKDGVLSETASIVVMETVAIGVDLFLSGDATMADPLFWSSLVVSLSLGLFAAYPVNVLLVWRGVKEGMMDPREHAPDLRDRAPDAAPAEW